MQGHIIATTQALLCYLILSVAYYGWGNVAIRYLVIRENNGSNPILLIWLGWAFTLFIFQLTHLLLPLTAYVVVPVLFAGVVFSIPKLRDLLAHITCNGLSLHRSIIAFIVFAIAAWVASRSMLAPTNYDSGLYHFNAIRWINTYSIVPGLGNLHGRLAFNSSFFTFVASLNFSPFFGSGRSLANSYLLLLTMASIIYPLVGVYRQPLQLLKRHPFILASGVLVVPMIGFIALKSNGLASPSPDFTSTLLQITMFLVLVKSVGQWLEGQRQFDLQAAVLVVLAVTAMTIKLSNLAFSAVIIGICMLYIFRTQGLQIHTTIRILVPTFVILIVWSLRGFIMSGTPLYPSAIGYIPVDWAVPIEQIRNEANSVYSYARQPGMHWSGSWDWVDSWSRRLVRRVDVMYPLIVALILYLLTVIIQCWSYYRQRKWMHRLDWIILLPMGLGFTYWFFSAPDPRFTHAQFWLFFLSSEILLLVSLQSLLKIRSFAVVFFILLTMSSLPLVAGIALKSHEIFQISRSGWQPVKMVPMLKKYLSGGQVIYTPKQGDQSWDSPIPSTPYYNPNLKLRTVGNLQSGFFVEKNPKNDKK